MSKSTSEQKAGQRPNPILFILPGLTSYAQTPYILSIVMEGQRRGYDIATVNHRGLAKGAVKTAQMYNFWSHGDSRECIEHVLNKYYETENRP